MSPARSVRPDGVEPVLEVGARGGRELRPGHLGVGVGDRRTQWRIEAAALEQPEVGLGLDVAQGEVRGRVVAVADVERQQVSAARRPAAGVVQAAQVEQVGLVVLRLASAAVDEEHLEAGPVDARCGGVEPERTRPAEECEPAASKEQRGATRSRRNPPACDRVRAVTPARLAVRGIGRNRAPRTRRTPASGQDDVGSRPTAAASRRLATPQADDRLAKLRAERDADGQGGQQAADHQTFHEQEINPGHVSMSPVR